MGTIKEKFNELDKKRSDSLDRARENAQITIPSVLPEEGDDESTNFSNNYTNVGSNGVKSLSNKTMNTLFPASTSYFRLDIDKEILAEESEENIQQFNQALGDIEKAVMKEFNTKSFRVPLDQSMKSNYITGNSLIYYPEEKDLGLRIFRLDSYVVDRDNFGNVLVIITKESISPLGLPDSIKELVITKLKIEDKDLTEDLELYTMVELQKDKKWKIQQEVEEEIIPESEGMLDNDNNPFIPVRLTAISGENYGRGLVEDNYADLTSLNTLEESSLGKIAVASKTVITVRPNGATRLADVATARNGDVIKGDPNDVDGLSFGGTSEYNMIESSIMRYTRRLENVFMMNSSTTRDAERVTATEVQYLAQELDSNLSGVYSLLSEELQLPLIKRMIKVLGKQGKIPKINEGVEPTITAGIEALGRTNDANKKIQWVQTMQSLVGPEKIAEILNVDMLGASLGLDMGVDTKGLIKSKEQVQAQKAEEMGDRVAENAINNGMAQKQAQDAQQEQPQETK